jgi:transcriptional regulator with XRE-family HTH domain
MPRPHKIASFGAVAYDYNDFCTALGKRVKAIRKEQRLTLSDMALRFGYHRTQLQRIESGAGISLKTMLLLSQSLQIPLEELVAGIGLRRNQWKPPEET